MQTDISLKAPVLLSSVVADGIDVLAVEGGAKQPAPFMPSGNGPFLLELRTR